MTPEQYANIIVSSESFFWLMTGSYHPQAHIDVLRPYWEAYQTAGGKVWAEAQIPPSASPFTVEPVPGGIELTVRGETIALNKDQIGELLGQAVQAYAKAFNDEH